MKSVDILVRKRKRQGLKMVQISTAVNYISSQGVRESKSRTPSNNLIPTQTDAFRLSTKNQNGDGSSLTEGWAASMRVQANERREQESLERMSKILPMDERRRPNPNLFSSPDGKARLTEAAERLLLEGLDGGARIAFQDAIKALHQQYHKDLGLEEGELAEARQNILRDARDLLSDFSIKPWSPYDQTNDLSLDGLGDKLEEKVLRHRQMVLESSGDFSRVLSELTVRAKEGDEVDLIRLGDFILRFNKALDARTTSKMREASKLEMLGKAVQDIDDNALQMGRSFVEYLQAKRA